METMRCPVCVLHVFRVFSRDHEVCCVNEVYCVCNEVEVSVYTGVGQRSVILILF